MFSVRIHGRGGQGAVTSAEMLSVAAFDQGLHAQAFPSFGSERTGAPVVAFCRIDDAPIRAHDPIAEPDAVIVQDPTLLQLVPVFAGIVASGFVLVNSSRPFAELGVDDLVAGLEPVPPRHGPGDRAVPTAAGTRAAQHRAPRRLRRADRRGHPGRGPGRDPAALHR